jgi:hypothetical protein
VTAAVRWQDPRPYLEARSSLVEVLDARSPAWSAVRPTPGVSVLAALSGEPPLWDVHAVAVGLWRSTGTDTRSWLRAAQDLGGEVYDYLRRFHLPDASLAVPAAIVEQAFDPTALVAAGHSLVAYEVCKQECGGDLVCIARCLGEAG